jgi:hypothetical protein
MTAIVDENGAPVADVPDVDFNDPAQLEAFYGAFSFFDHYRKSVLSSCKELIRGRAINNKEKLTETRIEDLARTHPLYMDFLATHYEGRTLREKNALASMSMAGR